MTDPIYAIPRANSPFSNGDGTPTTNWYNYLRGLNVAATGTNADLLNDITIISEKLGSPDGTPENIPPITGISRIIGNGSIAQAGTTIVTLSLVGDVAFPGNTYYYGTGPTGLKGFYTVSSAFLGTAGDIVLTVGSNGVTTIDLATVTQTNAGTLRAITLDTFGRVIGNRDATITGTAARITVTNGNASAGFPTIDIASTYIGQPSITTLGTITTGVWNGSVVTAPFGGTGQSSYVIGDILYASATNALSRLADVATGNVLRSGGIGVAPAWGKVSLTTDISGILPVANGGTGSTAGAVPPTRQIIAGTGLTGGGDLSSDRTLAIANTTVTPGTAGDSTHFPIITFNAQGQATGYTTQVISSIGLTHPQVMTRISLGF